MGGEERGCYQPYLLLATSEVSGAPASHREASAYTVSTYRVLVVNRQCVHISEVTLSPSVVYLNPRVTLPPAKTIIEPRCPKH